jgi:hypothetical protein
MFYSHLHNRGYPTKAIDAMFHKVIILRSKMLESRIHVSDDNFFAKDSTCVFSNQDALGSA